MKGFSRLEAGQCPASLSSQMAAWRIWYFLSLFVSIDYNSRQLSAKEWKDDEVGMVASSSSSCSQNPSWIKTNGEYYGSPEDSSGNWR